MKKNLRRAGERNQPCLMLRGIRPTEVAIAPLYLALPGSDVEPLGVLLLDTKADHLYCKINPTTRDKDASEVLSFMANDLVAMAMEQGGAVVFQYVQENLSNVVRVGDSKNMVVMDHPVNALERIFLERVTTFRAAVHTQNAERLSSSKRILLVEDNPADVLLIKRTLRDCAPTIMLTVATDGEQALQFIASVGTIVRAPDLVLLDLSLPNISGHEVLESLRTNPQLKATPVAVLSSSTSPTDMERAYRGGANLYLYKSTDLTAFIQSVSEVCSFSLRPPRLVG